MSVIDIHLNVMKINVLFFFNILSIISGYSQNNIPLSYSNTEINNNIKPLQPNVLPDTKFLPLEAVKEGLLPESNPVKTTDIPTIGDTLPWHKIDLGSPLMKQKSSKPFPWWIPITAGGAAVAATGVVLLLKDDDPDEPSIPIAINDQFTVPCKMNSAISPLSNDSGEGLRIIAFSGAPPGWVTFTDQTINILETASQNFTFTYTIMDTNGAQANATITITIEFTPIQLQSPAFQGGPGDIITHQIFTNAVCAGCTVTNANSAPQSTFTWTPAGAFSFEIPDLAQPQTILFTFNVTDQCMQTGTAQISVTVRPECDIEPSFIVSNEECDFTNGSIEVDIDPITDYQFQWSNGRTTALINGLSEGIYQVTITLISNPVCAEVFNVEVSASSPALTLVDDRYQTVSNVLLTGNVLNNDIGSQLRVTAFDDLNVVEFSILADGSFRFLADENAQDQYTSVYTVTDICGATSTAIVQFDVAKLPCDFSAAISTVAADCGRSNGNASVIINPAGAPYEIRWPNGTFGPSASGFSAGSYNLVITNTSNNCVLNFSFNITENPVPNYIQTLETSAATCIGGAQVDLLLNDPAGAAMQIIVSKGNVPIFSLNVNSGLIKLGEIVNFLPGDYQIAVSCAGCPARCAQIINITITQEFPLLEITDDTGSTPSNTVWSGNVLLNDFGTGMNVIGFTQPSAGISSVNANGLALYNPPDGFSGTVTFNYTVRDTCGQEKSAVVTINVVAIPCDFTVQFSNIPADCGQMNGSSTISFFPSGNSYQVSWPDGTQGFTNSMLLPGNYTVTITDASAGCTKMFSTIISELPPLNLIQEVTAQNGTCLEAGSVSYTISNPGPVDILVEIYLNNQFIFSTSINSLGTFSDEISPLSPGPYLLQALISGSPRRCADAVVFEIVLEELPMTLVDDNYTIPFGTVWIGNVLMNDTGTGLQVSGNTTTPNGIVQILPNGTGTFVPLAGFSGTATFQYFALDVCNQEKMANVNITVLPFLGGLNSENTSFSVQFEFFQKPLPMTNYSFFNSIPEGVSTQNFSNFPAFQNGLRYSMSMKNWLFLTEVSYGESTALDPFGHMIYQNSFQSKAGIGWLHDFNRNRIIAEAGVATLFEKSVNSSSFSSNVSRQSLQALYFKTEYQINLKAGYCIFWEPQIFYFPSQRQLSGLLSTGIKLVLE